MKKKHFKAVELKYLDNNTINKIREWRNQEFVREQMFTQNVIQEYEHQKWIDMIRNDDNRHLFVFYLDDNPFAVMQSRYYPEYEYVETGDYLISQEYQAMGYGTFNMYFIPEIIYHYLNYNCIHGEILDSNEKNLRNARKMGNVIKKLPETREVNGKLHDVYTVDSNVYLWNEVQKYKIEKLVSKFIYEEYEVVF